MFAHTEPMRVIMNKKLLHYIQSLPTDQVPVERQRILESIVKYIREKQAANKPVNLVFICTHNSRRSHFGQIWATVATHYYNLEGIRNYSGGTETTAFNPRAVAAIERAGFQVLTPEGSSIVENPHYRVSYDPAQPAIECFSKVYNDAFNPQQEFGAIMTCSEADVNCPFIPGAEFRASLTYEDPKVADGTAEETARYDERCRQIATELFALMRLLKTNQ